MLPRVLVSRSLALALASLSACGPAPSSHTGADGADAGLDGNAALSSRQGAPTSSASGAFEARACPTLPARAGGLPGFPGLTPVPGQGMATSLDPGKNIARETYRIDAPFEQVVAFYERCTRGPGAPSSDGLSFVVWTSLTSFPGQRTVAFSRQEDHTVAVVACLQCY